MTFLIWLESAFLPAAPLPCDSIVILSGTLGAMGVVDFKVIAALLILAAAIGYLLMLLPENISSVVTIILMVAPYRVAHCSCGTTTLRTSRLVWCK